MKKTQELSSFFYSQYFAEGLRITLGTIIPVIVCAFLGEFVMGTFISLGALIIGLSDTPGAPRHRRWGMLYCTLFSIIAIIATALANDNIYIMSVIIAVLSFIFSMFSVFNVRAATVGMMGILIMLINIDAQFSFQEEMRYLGLFIIGAVWYMLISFSLMRVRPYRIAQQELSETIVHIADYLRLKANFYDLKKDADDNYIKLIEKQIGVNEHQENVRDILFQSKRSIKDTTKEGRYLTLVFNEMVDLFEQSMTTHYDYTEIRNKYTESGILEEIKNIIDKIAHELDNFAFKLHANKQPKQLYDFEDEIERIRIKIEEFDASNSVNSIPLKKIVINIRTITKHVQNMYTYVFFKADDLNKEEIKESNKFINRDILNWQNFKDNLSLDSSVFRHALRMAIVLSGTYFLFNIFNYSSFTTYWILLTILVILKPGFGLTKERNLQRLIGTIIGGIIGGIILLTVPDVTIRFAILIFFFLIAYSLFRVNYILAVIFMTPYVLIMLSFTGVNTLEMAKERIIDTFIGGSIAFLSSYIIFPNWESFQIRNNMRNLLIANYKYLAQAIILLSDKKISVTEYKLARKEVYIASANMGSTFQRLITEPKWRQKNTKEVNRFVILNHIFSSYTATLLTQLYNTTTESYNNTHVKLLLKCLGHLEKSINEIALNDSQQINYVKTIEKQSVDSIDDETLLITDQLQFLVKISGDLQKNVTTLASKEI
ncbi:FUSC family protein [Sphingobacterium bovistauri]|uniref:FUSC family protein n=1 Tax=Sphingobacterium bovistauri TaxID=2781959 RepID=A0ABS7Z6V4_9SPHI|nr:FUSC family membrane protein [Sphingobacterium bovistauri]MCA5005292.1 FUSC family protein [Sphingobacterium bovistauri]